jgi:hypothetical protein
MSAEGGTVVDRTAIKAEINRLVDEGDLLRRREMIAHASEEDRKKFTEIVKDDPDKAKLLKKPNFATEYQAWYSPCLRTVAQLLSDRYDEFKDLYLRSRRKELAADTFGIADYISGIRPYSFGPKTAQNLMATCFEQQIAIVGTAEARLDSVLTDISRTLYAEILDDELGAARSLLTASHLRSAGVVAGVALEGHLKKMISDHKITFRKVATLSNLNNALKDAGVYDAPQWRQIQYLTDIRNLCGHKGDRNPERAEVEDLINGVAKIVMNLF